jgi:tRNA modification GTPase
MIDQKSTVCAISTPPGVGAIAIVRMSGPDAFTIFDKISSLPVNVADFPGHSVHFCKIMDNNECIDEVVVTIFKAPHSFTGEDTVEINCHGSQYIQQKLMELLLSHGAQLAQPGEFTLRAFLNNKFDLSQAEAVADLIQSVSRSGHKAAINQMRGNFARQLNQIRQQLVQFSSLLELELDFSEEDVEFADRGELRNIVENLIAQFRKLLDSFQYGNVIKNGVPVAIIGKPNVGKSTLLNVLLNEERAIVSEIPGTTRDAIEDVVTIEGFQFRFIDTAGIRHTADTVESLGIERTMENVKRASSILYLVDPDESVEAIREMISSLPLNDQQSVAVIINKIDKIQDNFDSKIKSITEGLTFPVIGISAKKNENIEAIHQFLITSIKGKEYSENDTVITNVRHYEALSHAMDAAERLLKGFDENLSNDILAEELRQILYYIGLITGTITNDEILENIFKNFCIGK